ncbi:MAG: hypothetical protein U1F76_06550 [Candidatus Competibacteraceae bacterium]
MSTDYQKIIDTLREKNGISSTIAVNDRNYVVTTTLKKSKYGWYYEITTSPNDRKATAPEDGRWQAPLYDSEEKWSAFLQEAAKQHADKCARVAGDSGIGTTGRKSLLLAAALAGIALAGGAGYFYFNLNRTTVPTVPPATVPSIPLPSPFQGSVSPPLPPRAPAPAVDPAKIEAIITSPVSKSPPLSVPPTGAPARNDPPKNKTQEDKAKEDKIRCKLSPQDCQ